MAGFRFDAGTLYLEGDFTLKGLDSLRAGLAGAIKHEKVERIDLSGIEQIDSAGTAAWDEILLLVSQEGEVALIPARPEVQVVINSSATRTEFRWKNPANQAGWSISEPRCKQPGKARNKPSNWRRIFSFGRR